MRRTRHKSLLFVTFIVLIMTVTLAGISLYKEKDELKREIGHHLFANQVEEYRNVIDTYAKKNGVEEHIDVLLAMMMQESGGRGNDPMQASESLCGEIGCIDDPELSIEQGVAYFAQALEAADGDLELAIQSYNFGIGFVHYVLEREQTFSQELAIQFSREMYEKAEDPSIYTCLREEAKQYNACYGDIYYVRDVMAYREKFAANSTNVAMKR